VQVVIQIKNVRRFVTQPRERFAVSDVVVGAHAGEVVPEGMQLVGGRIFDADFLAQLLEAFEQSPSCSKN
jgi:hypothetical protein